MTIHFLFCRRISCILGSVFLSTFLFRASDLFRFQAYSAVFLTLILAAIFSSLYLFYLGIFLKKKILFSPELLAGSLVFSIVYLNYLSIVFELAIEEVDNIYWCFFRSSLNIFIALPLFLLISLLVKFQLHSLFLVFLGNISFELFLIHNTFLIHFDFILFRGSVAITFVIYFLVVCSLSLLLKWLSAKTLSALSTAYQA